MAAIPAIGLLAGAAAGLLFPDLPSIVWSIALAVSVSAAAWSWRAGLPALLMIGVAGGFAAGGGLLTLTAWKEAWRPTLRIAFDELARVERADALAAGRAVSEDVAVFLPLEGVLRADAAATDIGASLSLNVDLIETPCPRPVSGGVLLTIGGDEARRRIPEWRAGRRIRAPAALRRPTRYLDPGVPDDERAMARRGTSLVGSVKSGALVSVVSRGSAWSEAAGAARSFARKAIRDAVAPWGARAAAIVTAIVIGDRAGLDAGLQRRLQEAGTYHVIAISGGNIAILAGLTLGLFRFTGFLGRGAMLTAAAALVVYACIVGGGASVDRATLMAVVYLCGRAIDLRGAALNALASVATLLVALDPLSVADPAFLLTCGATVGILVVAPIVRTRGWPRMAAPIVSMAVASLAAEAALLPAGAALFSRVTIAGLVLNFAAIPLMAVAQIAGMAVVPLAALSEMVARVAGWIAYVGAEGLVRSSDLVRLVPALSWRVAPPGWAAVVVYYAGVTGFLVLWTRGQRVGSAMSAVSRRLWHGAAVAACGGAIWIAAEPWRLTRVHGDGRLHVTFIDVGQGDAALIDFPRGDAILVDTGGVRGGSPAADQGGSEPDTPGAPAFDIGDRIVAPVLRDEGIGRMNALAITHGDADHMGGAWSLLREFKPLEVWEGIPVPPFEPLRLLRGAAASAGSRWTNLQTDDLMSLDGVRLVVRRPGLPDWERQHVRNDDSLVLELVWGDVSIVLTGDIGRETEEAIAERFAAVPLRIIKVPHHGSLTSSSVKFVQALAPRIAVVSVGRYNTFGHPAPAVLARYRNAGAAIFRTDQDGAVMLDTDGHTVDVHTYSGRTAHFTSN